MTKTQTQCHLETWQPEPTKTLVSEIPMKEGKNLPNSVTEDVIGIGLMPKYSNKQLRKLNKAQRKYSELLMMNTFTAGGSIQW
jgi:hypothetical protein